MQRSALFTDFYELTMAQGYWKKNKNSTAVFDMFFRRQPFGGGFSIFAGLQSLLETLENFSFSAEDLDYLRSLNFFEDDFLEYLKNFKFSGDLYAMQEGSVIFPEEPVLRVCGNIVEAQIIEGLVLNQINFQSLIATKTARIWLASNKGAVMEFGLRRAQGADGALSATRASYIGGASSTSNTLAGKLYGIPVCGTMAHSWIMSFDSELEAFRAYADLYPENSIFLIDTYDTLHSGIKNAIVVGKELAKKGCNFGVRLDSGDIQYLSKEVRRQLDEAGLQDAFITVSNELTEEIIETLVHEKAPVDSWGVGTNMVTGGTEASFSGVYKLAARKDKATGQMVATMKISDNPKKTTNPGIKNVWRLFDEKGMACGDILALEHETISTEKSSMFFHPSGDYRQFAFKPAAVKQLLELKIKDGKRLSICSPKEALDKARNTAVSQLEYFDDSYKRILNPHIYKVSVTEELLKFKMSFLRAEGLKIFE
ncbi:MAG: nicotinate phosphoribosyltransferase [Treponemataceae bacterium]|nr:nicotinate phosphoribosyltransferase [Treponemataceae bacterium]